MDNTKDCMKSSIDKALEVLNKGGVILYPTDTIWGIGCDATNEEAVKRIFSIKHRDDAKAMLMLVGSDGQLQQYVENVPDVAWELIDSAVNPITIIYDHPRGIAKNLLAEDGSAGFRITKEAFSRTLCQHLRRPLVSTSANVSGQTSPKSFADIPQEIIDAVDYVVKCRRDEINSSPSNIIKLSDNGVFRIIR